MTTVQRLPRQAKRTQAMPVPGLSRWGRRVCGLLLFSLLTLGGCATRQDHQTIISNQSPIKPSEFFRECVLQNRTQIVARPKASGDTRRLLYLFNKASNNLNQLAHTANAAELAGTVTPATYAGILAELQMLADLMKKVIHDAD